MGDTIPLYPKYKAIAKFPMWILGDFENMDDQAVAEALLSFAMTYMKNPDFIRKHITFEFLGDAEEEISAMSDEEFNEKILISREYVSFIKTLMDGGIIPPHEELPDGNK